MSTQIPAAETPDGVDGSPASGAGLQFANLPPIRSGVPFAAEFWIAVRHLMSRKSDAMISIVAVLAVVGVVASVALVNMVTSVMTGFEVDLRDKILGANAHVVVLGQSGQVLGADTIVDAAEQMPEVSGAAAFVYTEVILRSAKTNKYAGVILKGIDPERTDRVTSLVGDLLVAPGGALSNAEERLSVFRAMAEPTQGPSMPDVLALALVESAKEAKGTGSDSDGQDLLATPLEFEPVSSSASGKPLPGIMIGIELARTLGVGPGSDLQLMDPFGGAPGPMGMPAPRVRPVRVAAVYESGMYEYDNKWTYMANADVQDFMRMGDAVTGIEIGVRDIYAAPAVASALSTSVGEAYYSRNWQQMNQGLFEALQLEKTVSSMVLFSTVMIAALLIVCVLTMMVLTKGREIAILRAMGASRWGILRVFVIEGMLIGLVGAFGGTALGMSGCWLLYEYGWPLDTDVYFLNTLPVVIDPWNVAGIAIGAVITCFVATLYPAVSAALMEPVEGLRFE